MIHTSVIIVIGHLISLIILICFGCCWFLRLYFSFGVGSGCPIGDLVVDFETGFGYPIGGFGVCSFGVGVGIDSGYPIEDFGENSGYPIEDSVVDSDYPKIDEIAYLLLMVDY